MTNKTIELDYNSNLDQKLISKIGNPFKFDNPAMQDIMNKFYNTNEVVVNKKILVIRMYDMAVKYAENNSVIYITDNKEKYDKFLELINNEKYGGDDDAWFIEDYRNLDVEIGDMKFDIIIGNPPYGDNSGNGLSKTLHFDIATFLLNKYNEKMIFIMPNKIRNSTTKRFDKYKKEFTMLSEITNEGNPFEGFASVNTGIFVFKNHKVDKVNVCGIVYNNLFEISPFTEYENKFMNLLKNKKFAKKFYIPWPKSEKTKQYIRLTNIANGAKSGKWFSSIIENVGVFTKTDLDNWNNSHDSQYACVSSNNKNELENIEIAMKNPLIRFGLYKVQDDQSIKIRCYEYIPDIDWTDDRTKTDEGILEMVGFSKEESKEFADYTKNYMAKIDEQFNNRPRKKRKSKKDYFADMKD